ncbi:LysR family transcriptional regulator [Rhodococcus sp. NCIMB 12038]|uniref:LysR family transcriptional regulator n=1 Tax=Rhodococcus sp. NCIMB 12038 TaxID=933800 RepID=UPI000B3CF13D|nr:LysR family transcriptional regulator [Rhodococcus sp. NCIMB 12038]OUS84269.1 hypothetical protein CA951_40310 [Rhodococcus sp. NCIMB 12038]
MDLSGIARLDLNLLVPLEALLRERSVTRAAARLGLGQPALSASLAKLRRHFHDDLLQRVGNSYVLTPLAVQLSHRLTYALEAIGQVFDDQIPFDPSEVDREFTLLASDFATATIGGAIADLLHHTAPHARLRMSRFDLYSVMLGRTDLVEAVDGLVLPHGFVSGLPYVDVFSDRWMAIVSSANNSVGDKLTDDDVTKLSWVVAYRDAAISSAAEWSLRLHGIEVTASIVVDSFLALPALVADSNRAAFIESRLVSRAVAAGDVRAVELPGETRPLVEALWWHPSRTDDPAHTWFRAVVVEAGRSVSDSR